MGIGDILAQARRQADLTVTQVSQRTCIRETIIRGIERGDFSACGGDFYARGHIRSIARAVGLDPEPLVREYDDYLGAQHTITAADVFEPATPIKIRERRRPNWAAAMLVALAALVGFGVYHFVSAGGGSHGPVPAAGAARGASFTPTVTPAQPTPGPQPTPAAQPYANEVVIQLQASQPCFVQLVTANRMQVYSGVVAPGATMSWTEQQAVSLRLSNPAAVSLMVNGKTQAPGTGHQPVTLNYGPGQTTPTPLPVRAGPGQAGAWARVAVP